MPPELPTSALFRTLCLGLCLIPLVPACGGRSDTEDYLFGADPTAATGANGTGASSSTGAGSGDDPGDDPGMGANGNGANGTGANGNGGTDSATAGGESSVDPGGTGSGGTSSSGGKATGGTGTAGAPSGPRVSCGDTTCDTSKQVCCAGLGGFGCIPKNQECNGAVLVCSATDDCAGNNVCCLRIINDVNSGSVCKSSCIGMGPTRERQLCHADDECPTGHCRDTVFGVSVCTRR